LTVGASGETGLGAYAAILLEPRYRATLINTVLLAASTTAATLVNRAQRFICERRQYQATLWLRHHQPSNPPPARIRPGSQKVFPDPAGELSSYRHGR